MRPCRWDAAASVLIGVLLVVIAIVLAIETKGLLMGETATEEVEQNIAAAVGGHELVRGVIHLKTQHLGPDQLLVGVKAEFDDHLSMTELADAINDVEATLRSAVPIATVIYIEPDINRRAPA